MCWSGPAWPVIRPRLRSPVIEWITGLLCDQAGHAGRRSFDCQRSGCRPRATLRQAPTPAQRGRRTANRGPFGSSRAASVPSAVCVLVTVLPGVSLRKNLLTRAERHRRNHPSRSDPSVHALTVSAQPSDRFMAFVGEPLTCSERPPPATASGAQGLGLWQSSVRNAPMARTHQRTDPALEVAAILPT